MLAKVILIGTILPWIVSSSAVPVKEERSLDSSLLGRVSNVGRVFVDLPHPVQKRQYGSTGDDVYTNGGTTYGDTVYGDTVYGDEDMTGLLDPSPVANDPWASSPTRVVEDEVIPSPNPTTRAPAQTTKSTQPTFTSTSVRPKATDVSMNGLPRQGDDIPASCSLDCATSFAHMQ